jgi:tRNA (guanosine-2'-O-)-methyltransferase
VDPLTPQEHKVLQHLEQFVTEHKKSGIERILSQRTRNITVVLEDVYQPQNASAVVRTAECFGIQDVHIIENNTRYEINKYVLRGAQKWMNLVRYRSKGENNALACVSALRANGYRILVTDPDPQGISIHDVDVTSGKLALFFGNELKGASESILHHADARITIPMFGFTESFNLSVSVAICLEALVTRLRNSGVDIALSEVEKQHLRLQWFRKIVRNSALLEKEFLKSIE